MKILKQLQWVAAHLSWLTMVLSPVALGAEAEKLSKQQLALMIQEFGLNKKSTVGEFWQKSKAYYPPHIYKEVEQFVKLNPNLEIPAFEVSVAKATDNSEIPVLQSSQNGKINRIQFFGKKDNWAKFNNQALSEADLERPDDVFKRLMANDIKVKTEYDALAKKAQGPTAKRAMPKNTLQQMRDFSRFKGFPTITPMMWSSMTMEQRAGHVVNMRLMYMTAQKVLATENVKSSSKNFMELIFGSDAYAQASSAANRGRSGSAKACIVAGYVGQEEIGENVNGKNRRICSIDKALESYEKAGSQSYIKEANDECRRAEGPNFRACNPMQYSFPKGNPICIGVKDANFQTPTHREGVCDKKSPLSSSAMIMEFNGKDYSNVEPPTVRQAMIEEDQRKTNFAATKDFMEGLLAYGAKKNPDSKLLAMFQAGKWDAELDREMVAIQSVYETEVNRAIQSCHENIALKQADTQQKGACDQLHRRWLFTEKFVADFRKNGCPDGSKYIGAYTDGEKLAGSGTVPGKNISKTALNKSQLNNGNLAEYCKCDSGKQPVDGKCDVAAVIVPPLLPLDPKDAKGEKVTNVACPDGTSIVSNDDGNQCKCDGKDGKMLPMPTAQEDVERLCKKSNVWKWVLGGLGVLALIALFHKNKKTKTTELPPVIKPDEPVTPPTVPPVVPPEMPPTKPPQPVVPPPQSCMPPKVGPACVCPVSENCTPPQKIYNTETCQCTTVPTCSDGMPAPGNDLSKCPKPDTPKPPTPQPPAIPSEGGSGNNCPNGNCSGGAPSQKNKK